MTPTVPNVSENSGEKIEAYVSKLSKEDALLRRIRKNRTRTGKNMAVTYTLQARSLADY